jgi:hypothetical protein
MSTLIADSHKFFLSPSGAVQKHNGDFNSNLTFNLPNAYRSSNSIIYATARIIHAEIPNSFYIVNEYNNALHTSFGSFEIPFGNYNANTLMAYLKTVFPSNLSVSFSNTTGKFVFTSPNMAFSILEASNCGILLGFSNGSAYSSVNLSGVNTLTMPNPANLYGTKNIYIRLPELVLDNLNTISRDKTTISSIAKNVSPYGVILYNNSANSCSVIKNDLKGLDSNLRVELLDDQMNYIDFNAIEWSITLQFDFYISVGNIKENYSLT